MSRYPVHASGLASRKVGSEEVVVAPQAGKVWAFNAAGALLWELADGSLEIDELAGCLARARGIDRGAALDEAGEFLTDLEQRGLLAWRGVPSVSGARARRAAADVPSGLAEPPRVLAENPLQVVAAACPSGHTGQGPLCKVFGTCTVAWS